MEKKLLIIEDQESTRKLLGHFLGKHFEIVDAESPFEAIRWLNAGNRADAIITDILMPGMTGVEFLKKMGKSGSGESRVIVLTSVENSSEKLKCLKLGARDYIVKPFNPEELLLRIYNVVNA